MKLGRGIDLARDCIPEQYAAKKKNHFHWKANSSPNKSIQKPQVSSNQKNQDEIFAIIGKSPNFVSKTVGINLNVRDRIK